MKADPLHLRHYLILITIILPINALAIEMNSGDEELIRSIQRQQHIDDSLLPNSEVRLESTIPKNSYTLNENETPCTQVNRIALEDGTDSTFSFLPSKIAKETAFKESMCLGANNLNKLQKAAQQILISKGYITSQAMILPQDMANGILKLHISAGKVGNIRYEEQRGKQTAEGSISAFTNKLPLHHNKILNLRDLEQGLENLRRLPSVEANIQIAPSEEEGKSDLLVSWKQNKPIRFHIGIDNSGGKTTGKYQGTVALLVDNPLGLSDLFYVSYRKSLAHQTKLIDQSGAETQSGSHSYSIHYSVPVKKWLFSFDHNSHRYHEAKEGYSVNYDYNGKQYASSLTAERMLWRNGHHKTTATMKLWARQTYKYINDTEIGVQRRREAGWEAALHHRAYLNRWQFDGRLSYKRGTGMRNSMPAPEENASSEIIPGTSRMKVITAELNAATPLKLNKQLFSYETSLLSQWNKTPLVVQDKLSIGSRYTVRGFDGEESLSGERGFYWQNTLNWHFLSRQQLYFGLDMGRVSGKSMEYATRHHLVGAAAGLKGSNKIGGNLNYDLFMGKPLHKPKELKTSNTVYGFSLNYGF